MTVAMLFACVPGLPALVVPIRDAPREVSE